MSKTEDNIRKYLDKMNCFDNSVIDVVVSNKNWPSANKKGFAKLFANHIKEYRYVPFDLPKMASYYEKTTERFSNFFDLYRAVQNYDPTKDLYGNDIVHRFSDGFTMVKVSPENVLYEGVLMANCVGTHGYDRAIKEKVMVLYSLHDLQDRPHVHISMVHKKWIKQIKGRANSIPIKQYVAMLEEWLKANGVLYLSSKEYHEFADVATLMKSSIDSYVAIKSSSDISFLNLFAASDDPIIQSALVESQHIREDTLITLAVHAHKFVEPFIKSHNKCTKLVKLILFCNKIKRLFGWRQPNEKGNKKEHYAALKAVRVLAFKKGLM